MEETEENDIFDFALREQVVGSVGKEAVYEDEEYIFNHNIPLGYSNIGNHHGEFWFDKGQWFYRHLVKNNLRGSYLKLSSGEAEL